jgi:hypothetical protein
MHHLAPREDSHEPLFGRDGGPPRAPRQHLRSWRGARRRLQKAAIRKLRGLPSRDISLELMFDLLEVKRATRRGAPVEPEVVAKLQWRRLRERLLERKRAERLAARRRRPTVTDTRINLWRRRRTRSPSQSIVQASY